MTRERLAVRTPERGLPEPHLGEDCILLLLGYGVALGLALAELVQRRLRDVYQAARHQLRHLAVEQRQQQRPDVRPVDVRVGHHDDLAVA